MPQSIMLHQGVIRPNLVAQLEAFRVPEQRVSSYYLDLGRWGSAEAARLAVKNALAEHRQQLDQLELRPAQRSVLRREWQLVQEIAFLAAGERRVRGLACFVASENGHKLALRLPWSVRSRAFFEDRFVVWPLRQILDQASHFAVCLSDKDEARLYLVYLEQIEPVSEIVDTIPGRVRFPDPYGELAYMHKHIEHSHRHFARVADAALKLFRHVPFDHLIIGGLWETLPQFESYLHDYLQQRIVARWDLDVHTPTLDVLKRALQEEQHLLEREAQDIWHSIQQERTRRGALGADEVFAALWQRRVEALLVKPEAARSGYRCSTCGRLCLVDTRCPECGGETTELPDIDDEAIHDAIEQSAHVRCWKDPAPQASDSVAALKRF